MGRQTALVFGRVLPEVVRWAIAPAGVSGADLLAEERRHVAAAVPGRVQEFAAGRVAARAALDALGVAPAAIPAGPSRRPCWPAGVVGSITHCRDLAAAAVARASDLSALGIDAEPAQPLEPDVLDVVVTAAERGRLRGVLDGTVVFCAKEAFYKCWSSAGGPLLGFDDVETTVHADGSFVVRPTAGSAWRGRWAVTGGFVVTASWVEAP